MDYQTATELVESGDYVGAIEMDVARRLDGWQTASHCKQMDEKPPAVLKKENFSFTGVFCRRFQNKYRHDILEHHIDDNGEKQVILFKYLSGIRNRRRQKQPEKGKEMRKRILPLVISVCIALTVSASAETLQIGIPDDGTNLSRGIKLLEAAGLITVDPDAGYAPELADITGTLYDIEVVPAPANTLPSTLGDYGASAINGNYAIPNGLIPSRDGLIIEQQSEHEDNPYVNIIAVRTEDAENETYQKIVDAYQTQLVAEFMLIDFNEIYYPAFTYDSNIQMTADEVKEIAGYVSDKDGKTVVKVGVCGANNDQWKAVQKILDDENAGIYIELVEFDAYNQPNEALNSGEIDLNAFQHKAYLINDAANNGYDLTVLGDTLIAPLTLYSAKYDSLDALKEAAGETLLDETNDTEMQNPNIEGLVIKNRGKEIPVAWNTIVRERFEGALVNGKGETFLDKYEGSELRKLLVDKRIEILKDSVITVTA